MYLKTFKQLLCKPENKYPRVPDILSGTNWLVPDTGHFVPDIKKLQ